MDGLVIVYEKQPCRVTTEETPYGTSFARELQRTETAEGPVQFSTLGQLVPYVYLNGRSIGVLTRLEVKSDTKLLRPTVLMERVMWGPEDAILTLTPEEHEAWRASNLVKEK